MGLSEFEPPAERLVELMSEVLRRTHLSEAADLGRVVAEETRRIGAEDTALYLIDYEQSYLMPVHAETGEPLSVAGTVAGRSFASTAILRSEPTADSQRVWLPLLDGTERIGVIGLTFRGSPGDRLIAALERFAHLLAMVIVTKSAYSDVFEVIRRRRAMTVATEMAWTLVPPLVFATDDVALAAMLEPVYDNGGDTFDYAMNNGVLHLGLFDAMGHGLAAVGAAGFAVTAYRHSRRLGHDLCETHRQMHDAIASQFGEQRFVTALIVQLVVETGELSWITAGHPPPLLIRKGRRATNLEGLPLTPLGVDVGPLKAEVSTASLQPADLVLFYTDGLPEARAEGGEVFSEERLADFIDQAASAGQSAPETLRRLRHSIIEGGATLRDDATAVLIDWKGGSEAELVPDTVLS